MTADTVPVIWQLFPPAQPLRRATTKKRTPGIIMSDTKRGTVLPTGAARGLGRAIPPAVAAAGLRKHQYMDFHRMPVERCGASLRNEFADPARGWE